MIFFLIYTFKIKKYIKMKGTFEENTNEFYKELNGNCDPDKLLEIVKHGIYLNMKN